MEEKKKTLEEQLRETMSNINAHKLSDYQMNADKLYQQYKDAYTKQGALAQENTIGKASSMTGGYGNSYAETLGKQAYEEQMKALGEVESSLYTSAMEQYLSRGQELADQKQELIDELGIDVDSGGNPIFDPSDDIVAMAGSFVDNLSLREYINDLVKDEYITTPQAENLYERFQDKNEAYSPNKGGDYEVNYKMMIRRAMNDPKGAGWTLSDDGDIIAPNGNEMSRKEWSELLQELGVPRKQAKDTTKALLEKLENLNK
jgi:hypothetical protein